MSTTQGLYKYTVTAMGLKNAGTDFQRAVQSALNAFNTYNKNVTNYLDDVIAFAATQEEHALAFELLCKCLRADGWYLSFKKSQIAVTSVKLLGFWLGSGRVECDPEYVTKIMDLPSPRNVKGVQRFLGLIGYYRHFVPGFAQVARPLTALVHKNALWVWTDKEETAMRLLIQMLNSSLSMVVFVPGRPLRMSTDASGIGLGAVLEQPDDGGTWKPIAFFSKALNETEQRLVNYERELYAIYAACKRWTNYLIGTKFEIRCDCIALQSIRTMSFTHRKRRVVSMLIHLGQLDFSWVHVEGKKNAVADYLSRALGDAGSAGGSHEDLLRILPSEGSSPPLGDKPTESIYSHHLDDMESLFSLLHEDGQEDGAEADNNWAEELIQYAVCALTSAIDGGVAPSRALMNTLSHYPQEYLFVLQQECARRDNFAQTSWTKREELLSMSFELDLPITDIHSVFPETLNSELSVAKADFDIAHTASSEGLLRGLDEVIAATPEDSCALQMWTAPPQQTPFDYTTPEWVATAWENTAHGPWQHYARDASGVYLLKKNAIVVPPTQVAKVLHVLHTDRGHIGFDAMKRLVANRFWWPDMTTDIKKLTETCPTCAARGQIGGRLPGLLGLRPECSKAEEIAIDYCHLREMTQDGVKYQGVLGIIDRASRFVRWIPCTKEFTTRDIFSLCMRHWISVFGFPTTVRSDNEPKLDSNLWGRFWAGAGCVVSHSTPYHPRGNGIIERSFRTLLMRLRTMLEDLSDCNWIEMLPFLEGFHNATPRDSLAGLSPAEVMLGYAPRWDNLPFIIPCRQTSNWLDENSKILKQNETLAREALRRYSDRMKQDVDKKRKKTIVKVGDLILVRRARLPNFQADKIMNPYTGPFKVTAVLGNHRIRIVRENTAYDFSINDVILFKGHHGDKESAPMQNLIRCLSTGETKGVLPEDGVWDMPYPSTDEEEGERLGTSIPPSTMTRDSIKIPRMVPPSTAPRPPAKVSPAGAARIFKQANVNPYAATMPPVSLESTSPAVRSMPYVPPVARSTTGEAEADETEEILRFTHFTVDSQPPHQHRFHGIRADQTKDAWVWEKLASWSSELQDWLVTDALLKFFQEHLSISTPAVHFRLSVGDLPGFFEEVVADPNFRAEARRAGDFLFSRERENSTSRIQRHSSQIEKWERLVYGRQQ
jgi:hypothetical protein